jgi:hypothetical protein
MFCSISQLLGKRWSRAALLQLLVVTAPVAIGACDRMDPVSPTDEPPLSPEEAVGSVVGRAVREYALATTGQRVLFDPASSHQKPLP